MEMPPTDSESPHLSDSPERKQPHEPPAETPPPVFGRTLYDAIVHDGIPLLLKPKTGIPIGIIAIAVTLTLFMLRTDGLIYEGAWVGVRVGGNQAERQSTNLRQCLAEARSQGKPYAIESLTYWIQLEKDVLDGAPAQRQTRRVFYTLRSLQPITSVQEVFKEELDTHHEHATFEHWYGTENEVFHDPFKKKFEVLFDMAKDDVRTVVTGANFVAPLPFQSRTEFNEHLNVLSNQDFYAYPNEVDAICELNMVIESRSLAIQTVGNAAKRFFEGSLQEAVAKLSYDQSSNTGVRTISARWRNVKANETVGIHLSWPDNAPAAVQTPPAAGQPSPH